MSFAGSTPGMGAGAEVVEVVERAVEVAIACAFFSDRVEYMAAVIPAPVAALAAAIKAKVVLDIFGKRIRQGAGGRGVFIQAVEQRQGSWCRDSRHSGTIRRA